jgi:hypothetical protein
VAAPSQTNERRPSRGCDEIVGSLLLGRFEHAKVWNMNEERSVSPVQQIASWRQFFKSSRPGTRALRPELSANPRHRGPADVKGGKIGDRWADTEWNETQWFDTVFDQ